jgi:endonuclease/exonuclease/phosphatase family metal-dependent hydrolase
MEGRCEVSAQSGVGLEPPRQIQLRRYGALAILGLLMIFWVLNVSRPGARVEGCAEGCAAAGLRRDGPLRVMSLNVLHGFPRFERLTGRLDRIADEVRRQDADVVCLQEVGWTPYLGSAARYLARRTGLNYLYLRANGNRWTILFEEGEVILSRYALRDVALAELEPGAGLFEHRMALRATAVTPWGDVRVFVTHLTHGDPTVNRDQAASLAAFVAASGGEPAIVAGDFNALESSPQIRGLGWIDTYRAIHPDGAGFTCCIGDLSGGPDEPLEKRIDYIFLVPGAGYAEVTGSQRVLDRPFPEVGGWLWASDHVGLLTAVSMGQ